MVEVYVVVPYEIGNNYYAFLTGRWYLSPSGVLWLEVYRKYELFWPIVRKQYTFVTEESIREIQGEIGD